MQFNVKRNMERFTWIVVIKIFAIKLPTQPFLGRHLEFHTFSPWYILHDATPFIAWVYITAFVI